MTSFVLQTTLNVIYNISREIFRHLDSCHVCYSYRLVVSLPYLYILLWLYRKYFRSQLWHFFRSLVNIIIHRRRDGVRQVVNYQTLSLMENQYTIPIQHEFLCEYYEILKKFSIQLESLVVGLMLPHRQRGDNKSMGFILEFSFQSIKPLLIVYTQFWN